MDGIVIALAAAAALLALVAGVVAVRAQVRARRYGAALHELESALRPISERIRGAVERARPTADGPATAPAPNLEELLERIAADGSAIGALRQIADEVSPESGARRRPAFRGNRSEYEAELEREIARARRTGRSLALVLVDVDQATPDRLLQLAAVLARVPRVTDTVCRRRRDAFGILLPETTTEGARRFRDRLQAEAAESFTESFTGSGRATFSTGVVEWRPNESGEALDARARAALESGAAGSNGIAADSIV